MAGLICGSMETTWGQPEDNVETTWGPQGCGDHMGTMSRQHGMWGPQGCEDHVGTTWETTWGQHGDHRDVETTWGHYGDNMGTA